MSMQEFYQWLSAKAEEPHHSLLVRLTHVSRTKVLDITSYIEWFVWKAETPSN